MSSTVVTSSEHILPGLVCLFEKSEMHANNCPRNLSSKMKRPGCLELVLKSVVMWISRSCAEGVIVSLFLLIVECQSNTFPLQSLNKVL
jgi:hypothetical protein